MDTSAQFVYSGLHAIANCPERQGQVQTPKDL